MFTFTKEILREKVHFCTLICASKQTENTVKEKIPYFLKNYVASKKTFQFSIFLPLGV